MTYLIFPLCVPTLNTLLLCGERIGPIFMFVPSKRKCCYVIIVFSPIKFGLQSSNGIQNTISKTIYAIWICNLTELYCWGTKYLRSTDYFLYLIFNKGASHKLFWAPGVQKCYISRPFNNWQCLWSVVLTKYCSGDKIEKNEKGGAWIMYGERTDVYRIFVGKPEGKRLLGKPRHRWEYNNKMNIQEVGFGGMDWIDLAQDRDRWRALVNAVMNLRIS